MSSTLQLPLKTSTANVLQSRTDVWQLLFPMYSTKTITQSCTFLKRMTYVTISSILFRKGMFPKDAFLEFKIDNLAVNVLKPDSPSKTISSLHNWIFATFDSIDKKYLQRIDLCFYEDKHKPETLIESYSCKFKYDDDEFVTEIRSTSRNSDKLSLSYDQTQKCALNILKYVSMLGSKNELPNKHDICMRLFYRDGVTPLDYEVEGFSPCLSEDSIHPQISDHSMCGKLSTPFHKLKVYEYVKKADHIVEMTNEDNSSQSPTKFREISPNFHRGSLFDPIIPPNMDFKSRNGPPDNEEIMRCPCGTNVTIFLVIQCTICKYRQHGACFGLLDCHTDYIEKHICDVCAAENRRLICTDETFLTMGSRNKEAICVFRLMMLYCMNHDEFDFKNISKELALQKSAVTNVRNLLIVNLIIKKIPKAKANGSTQMFKVNVAHLTNAAIPNNFKELPNNTYLDKERRMSNVSNVEEETTQEFRDITDPDDDIFKKPIFRKRSLDEANLPLKKRNRLFV